MNGPARPAEITGRRLFVHECRCMAAFTKAAGTGRFAVKSGRQGLQMRE
jgi:hypothetical protein